MSALAKEHNDAGDATAGDQTTALRPPQSWRERMMTTQKKLDVTDIFEPQVGRTPDLWGMSTSGQSAKCCNDARGRYNQRVATESTTINACSLAHRELLSYSC